MIRRLAGAGLVVMSILGVVACSGGDAKDPSRTSSSSSASSSTTGTAETGVQDKVFSAPAERVVGAATGTLLRQKGKQTAEVLAVVAGADSTLLRWQLKSADGQDQSVTDAFRGLAPVGSAAIYSDLRDVKIIEPKANLYTKASTYKRLKPPASSEYCLCSALPQQLGAEPVHLYGEYAPLDPATTTVDVQVPGLPVIRNVTVTRQ